MKTPMCRVCGESVFDHVYRASSASASRRFPRASPARNGWARWSCASSRRKKTAGARAIHSTIPESSPPPGFLWRGPASNILPSCARSLSCATPVKPARFARKPRSGRTTDRGAGGGVSRCPRPPQRAARRNGAPPCRSLARFPTHPHRRSLSFAGAFAA